MSANTIVIAGNLTADPVLRSTNSGKSVANFTIADTPRYQDSASGEWRDGEPLFQRVVIWGSAAENVAESLARGTRVVVTGHLAARSYDDGNGETKTYTEVVADEVGVSLKFATATPTRTTRS